MESDNPFERTSSATRPNTYFVGQLLLSMPAMPDPRFKKSVIAMCRHDANGALGINLGELVEGIDLHRLMNQVGIDPRDAPNVPVHKGGPVDNGRGFIVHSLDYKTADVLNVGDKWGLSGSLELLRAIANGKGPKHWLVALGYSGWSAGQLESEMAMQGWLLANCEHDTLFEIEAADRWEKSYANEQIDPRLISADFGTA